MRAHHLSNLVSLLRGSSLQERATPFHEGDRIDVFSSWVRDPQKTSFEARCWERSSRLMCWVRSSGTLRIRIAAARSTFTATTTVVRSTSSFLRRAGSHSSNANGRSRLDRATADSASSSLWWAPTASSRRRSSHRNGGLAELPRGSPLPTVSAWISSWIAEELVAFPASL
jgi:hypothetical protein